MKTLRLALAQINPTVGDIEGNVEKIIVNLKESARNDADIVLFPELSITGCPPGDLLLNKDFLRDVSTCLDRIIPYTKGLCAIIGHIDIRGSDIYNSAILLAHGHTLGVCDKSILRLEHPCNDLRYFKEGTKDTLFVMDNICFQVFFADEILVTEKEGKKIFSDNSSLILAVDASFYYDGKIQEREIAWSNAASHYRKFIANINLVGGQDESVFYGGSHIVDPQGKAIAWGALFREDLLITDIHLDDAYLDGSSKKDLVLVPLAIKKDKKPIKHRTHNRLDYLDEVYSALVLATKDYAKKNGFSRAVLGLSGGLDSTLVAAIAKDALGSDNVTGISMPTRYTPEDSRNDARILAKNLGIHFLEIPIDDLFQYYIDLFHKSFPGEISQITRENIQPRIRGNILMAFSNSFIGLVLTAGNKSEAATGYSTLYGDTAGGYAVIRDVPKTLVFELSRRINAKAGREVIPESILTKAPSAELKGGQKDTDTLPPYDLLDPMLKKYIEENDAFDDIVESGYDRELLRKVTGMIYNNEYKRRQSPLGPRISRRSLGGDRLFPLTNRYRH